MRKLNRLIILASVVLTLLLQGCTNLISDKLICASNNHRDNKNTKLKLFDNEFNAQLDEQTNISVGVIEPNDLNLTTIFVSEKHLKTYLFSRHLVKSKWSFTDYGVHQHNTIFYANVKLSKNPKAAYLNFDFLENPEFGLFYKKVYGPRSPPPDDYRFLGASQPPEFEQIVFCFSKNSKLNTHKIKTKGTIILLHGLWLSKEHWSNYILANILALNGYRTISVDLPGHGSSTGKYITYGKQEAKDIKALIDYLEKENLITGNLGIGGISLGGAIAIDTAAIDNRIKSVVAIESYANLSEIAIPFIRELKYPFANFVSDKTFQNAMLISQKKIDYNPATDDPIVKIKNVHSPILLIHSKQDKHISCEQSIKLHNAAPQNSKLILLEKTGHMNIGTDNLYAFTDMIIDWYDKNL